MHALCTMHAACWAACWRFSMWNLLSMHHSSRNFPFAFSTISDSVAVAVISTFFTTHSLGYAAS